MADEVLERFHRALIEEIRSHRPEYLTAPFTVAEIYQNLVPYGSHRDRIGVEMNGDYEDALVRLLAGEGEYLVLESEPALRNLRAELKRPSPNTGVYREFAAVDVRLNAARIDLSTLAADIESGVEDDQDLDQEIPSLFASAQEMGIVAPGVDIFGESDDEAGVDRGSNGDESPRAGDEDRAAARPALAPEYVAPPGRASGTAANDGACRWCRAELPARDSLNFCPFCGTDVNLVPCPDCGEAIEPGWSFCAACGAQAS